jgi:sugar (pentulose or hexulose) kinase
MSDLVLGIDVGTSAVRVAAIDQAGRVAAFAASAMPAPLRDGTRITQDPAVWLRGLDDAMTRLASAVDLARIGALAVDGTSGTLVAVDELGRPVAAGSLYNDRADDAAVAAVGRVASARAAVHGATSPLARAARLQRTAGVARIIHQADWIAGQFNWSSQHSNLLSRMECGYETATSHLLLGSPTV